MNVVNTHIPDFGQPEFVDELVSLVGLAEYTLEILPHLQQNLDPHADLLEERGVRTVALDLGVEHIQHGLQHLDSKLVRGCEQVPNIIISDLRLDTCIRHILRV